MTQPQFTINYNGHKTAVTSLGDDIYLVQITFKPYKVQRITIEDGSDQWIEMEINKETPLSKTIGALITNQYAVNA